MYGDIGDMEIVERLNIKQSKIIISTVPRLEDNLFLIKKARHKNKKVVIFVTASTIDEGLKLYDAGADYVILPHFLGGDHVSYLLQENVENMDTLLKTKLKHIKELTHRKSIGHEHPVHH
jgi:voltage-gated potassium channel Kch